MLQLSDISGVEGEKYMDGLEKLRPMALLLVRIGLGVIFIYNGYPKLFGHTRESMLEMAQDGLPAYFTYIAGVLELGGGAALIAGFYTRLIGLLLAVEMAIAIWKGEQIFAHPLAVDQYELALALGVGAFALATFGAGAISLDRMLPGKGKSPRGAMAKG
jgi:putative oxidoreductase